MNEIRSYDNVKDDSKNKKGEDIRKALYVVLRSGDVYTESTRSERLRRRVARHLEGAIVSQKKL